MHACVRARLVATARLASDHVFCLLTGDQTVGKYGEPQQLMNL